MSTLNLSLLTDLYEMTMMQGYFKTGKNEENANESANELQKSIEYKQFLVFSSGVQIPPSPP